MTRATGAGAAVGEQTGRSGGRGAEWVLLGGWRAAVGRGRYLFWAATPATAAVAAGQCLSPLVVVGDGRWGRGGLPSRAPAAERHAPGSHGTRVLFRRTLFPDTPSGHIHRVACQAAPRWCSRRRCCCGQCHQGIGAWGSRRRPTVRVRGCPPPPLVYPPFQRGAPVTRSVGVVEGGVGGGGLVAGVVSSPASACIWLQVSK